MRNEKIPFRALPGIPIASRRSLSDKCEQPSRVCRRTTTSRPRGAHGRAMEGRHQCGRSSSVLRPSAAQCEDLQAQKWVFAMKAMPNSRGVNSVKNASTLYCVQTTVVNSNCYSSPSLVSIGTYYRINHTVVQRITRPRTDELRDCSGLRWSLRG